MQKWGRMQTLWRYQLPLPKDNFVSSHYTSVKGLDFSIIIYKQVKKDRQNFNVLNKF